MTEERQLYFSDLDINTTPLEAPLHTIEYEVIHRNALSNDDVAVIRATLTVQCDELDEAALWFVKTKTFLMPSHWRRIP